MKQLRTKQLCLMLLVNLNLAVAQNGVERDTKGAGGVYVGATTVEDRTAISVGGSGGWFVGKHLQVGGGGSNVWTDLTSSDGAADRGTFGYGGAFVGYWPEGTQRSTLLVSALVGYGGYTIERALGNNTYFVDRTGGLVLETEVGMRTRVRDHVWLAPAIAYRHGRFGDKDLSGWRFVVHLLFGER